MEEKETIFENDRFWKCAAKIKAEGEDPADILEKYLDRYDFDRWKESPIQNYISELFDIGYRVFTLSKVLAVSRGFKKSFENSYTDTPMLLGEIMQEMAIKQLDLVEDLDRAIGKDIRLIPDKGGEEETKPKSIFEDPRFPEYVAQINIDGHNPVDILEAWLKEHNPDFLEDD